MGATAYAWRVNICNSWKDLLHLVSNSETILKDNPVQSLDDLSLNFVTHTSFAGNAFMIFDGSAHVPEDLKAVSPK